MTELEHLFWGAKFILEKVLHIYTCHVSSFIHKKFLLGKLVVKEHCDSLTLNFPTYPFTHHIETLEKIIEIERMKKQLMNTYMYYLRKGEEW